VDPGKPSLWSPKHLDSQNGPKMLEELLALGVWSWSKTSVTALQFPFEAKANKTRIDKTRTGKHFLNYGRFEPVWLAYWHITHTKNVPSHFKYSIGAKKGSCRFWPQVVAMWPSANVSKVFSGWASWTDGGPLEFRWSGGGPRLGTTPLKIFWL